MTKKNASDAASAPTYVKWMLIRLRTATVQNASAAVNASRHALIARYIIAPVKK